MQYQKQNKERYFFTILKDPQKKYSWEDVYLNIINYLKKYQNI